jgi:ribosome-associated protein
MCNLVKLTSDYALSPDEAKNMVVQSLDSDKAVNIEVIDLSVHSYIADYMIVATGSSTRQVVALAEKLKLRFNLEGLKDVQVEGAAQGDWVIVDAGDIIIHIFREEVREYYGIEKMWSLTQPIDFQDGARV